VANPSIAPSQSIVSIKARASDFSINARIFLASIFGQNQLGGAKSAALFWFELSFERK
jgi:hypothetical protein